MNDDQLKIDFLYHSIYLQLKRYKYFDSKKISAGIWNKAPDELDILNLHIKDYINFYKGEVDKLKIKFLEEKTYNISSYLTLNTAFYIKQYDDRLENISTYLSKLDTINSLNVLTTDLSIVADDVPVLCKPTLLGKL